MDRMLDAISLGYKAHSKGEVPVGAIIVKNDKVVAKAFNTRERDQIATHHAEIKAIEKACHKLKSWRLDDCDLYVTLEPCPMCAGAIINARIRNLYYGLKDEKSGGISRFNMLEKTMNHTTNTHFISSHEAEIKDMIQSFFKEKRKNK